MAGSQETGTKIDYRFKILYAVAMIMVVAGHADGGGISLSFNGWFPYSGLHLPLFMFCSGYFYKDWAEEHFGKFLIKKTKSIILPLYIYTFVYGIIVYILHKNGFGIGKELSFRNLIIAPISDGHQFAFNMGGWFVVPLFMILITSALVRKLLGRLDVRTKEIVFFIICLVAGIIGNRYLGCRGPLEGRWLVLGRMFYFVPFFGLGVFYKRVLEKYDTLPTIWYLLIVFAAKFVLILWLGTSPKYIVSWFDNFHDGPVVPVIVGFLGIALWMRIATVLEPVLGQNKLINVIADNTYSIMMNQFAGFMLVKAVYGWISTLYVGLSDFDWTLFKNDIWWFYQPFGLEYTLVIYVIAGIGFSVLVQKVIDVVLAKTGMNR